MKALTRNQSGLYGALQEAAATLEPSLRMAPEGLPVARQLVKLGLAQLEGMVIRPTPEAIEFRRSIAARRREKEKAA